MDLSEMLNIDQSPTELQEIHAEDYYWYLSHPNYKEQLVSPIANVIKTYRPLSVLDVGCGKGLFGECFPDTYYVGIEGSDVAVDRARVKGLDVRLGRMENPTEVCKGQFDFILFSNLLEVLVLPERRIEFIEAYTNYYEASNFLIVDLERLDLGPIDQHFKKTETITIPQLDIPGVPLVKLQRKGAIYSC